MISAQNVTKAQYSIGNQGIRRYATYNAEKTVSAGAWVNQTINTTVYQNDSSQNRFKDYVVGIYGNFIGGPNDNTKWYEAKTYSKSALYREVPAGTIYNFIFDIKQNKGFGGTQFNGVTVTIYQTGPLNVNDQTTFRFTMHIIYSPFQPGDFVV